MANLLDQSIACRILEDLPTSILLMGNRRIEWVNKALARAFDMTREELTGLDTESAADTLLAPIFEDSDRFDVACPHGGTLWFRRQKIKLAPDSLEVQIFTDISRQVELENELERLVKDL
ncbi:MAG: hypothetical protein L0Y39_12205, partial [Methylococcaceae bacterium]|nr:hypothetical protein [Methylococcaceae bacterium]